VGFAGDYVDAMWRISKDEPEDYVIGTGQTFRFAILRRRSRTWLDYREYGPIAVLQAAEVDLLIADPSKAKERLGGPDGHSRGRPRDADPGASPRKAVRALIPAAVGSLAEC
jgi:hypothetical protein